MTLLMPTCAETVALLTDYEEGALGPLGWFGLKLHLSLCPPCRAFLASLRRTPEVLKDLWPEPPAPPAAERALGGALAALRQGRVPRGPVHHPEDEAWNALEPGGDPLMALLLRVHLGQCGDCRNARGGDQALEPGPDPLETLRPHLPPESQWRWVRRGLGGARVARVLLDPATGASLNLARLPGDRPMPLHRHGGPEISLVLAGGMKDGPAHLRSGDWVAVPPGTCHSPHADSDGCWALLRMEGGMRFAGWRSLLGVVH